MIRFILDRTAYIFFIFLLYNQLSFCKFFIDSDKRDFFLPEIRFNGYVLDDSFEVQVSDGIIYIDFDNLVKLVEFNIQKKGNSRVGWFFNNNNTFHLNVNQKTLVLCGTQRNVSQENVFFYENRLLVSIDSISDWFRLRYYFDSKKQILDFYSDDPLLFQQRIERDKKQSLFKMQQNRNKRDENQKVIEIPNKYNWANSPQVDLSATANYRKNNNDSQTNHSLAITAGFDLFRHSVFYNRSELGSSSSESLSRERLTVEKKSFGPQSYFWGGFNSYEFGDIYMEASPLISSGGMGRGFRISRDRYFNNSNNEEIEVITDGPPMWDAELYRDGILMDFGKVDATGRVIFNSVDLYYGRNSFVVKLYSPYGEIREKKVDYWGGGRPIETGEINYHIDYTDLTSGFIDSDLISYHNRVNWVANAQIEGALNKWLQIGGSFSEVEVFEDDNPANKNTERYVQFNTRIDTRFATFLSNWAYQLDKGSAYRLSLYSVLLNQQFRLGYEAYEDNFLSHKLLVESRYQSMTHFDISSSIRMSYLDYYMFRFSERKRMDGSDEKRTGLTLNGHLANLYWNNRIEHVVSPGLETRYEGLLKISSRYRNFLLRSEIDYDLSNDDVFRNVSGILGWNLNRNFYNQTRVTCNLLNDNTYYLHNELSWRKKEFTLSFTLLTDFHQDWSVGVRFSAGLGFNEEDKIYVNANPIARKARIRLRFFVDENNNNKYDENESTIEGIRVNKYNNKGQSGENGSLLLMNIPAEYAFELDESDLATNDPFLVLKGDLIRVFPHAGGITHADIPLVEVASIEGFVSEHERSRFQPCFNYPVSLVEKGRVIDSTLTQYDGYYSFNNIPVNKEYTVVVRNNTSPIVQKERTFELSMYDDFLTLDDVVFEKRQMTSLSKVDSKRMSLSNSDNLIKASIINGGANDFVNSGISWEYALYGTVLPQTMNEFCSKADCYTVRIEVASVEKTIRTALKSIDDIKRLYMIPSKLRNGSCFIVCYGAFLTRKEALDAMNNLNTVFFEEGNQPYVVKIHYLLPKIDNYIVDLQENGFEKIKLLKEPYEPVSSLEKVKSIIAVSDPAFTDLPDVIPYVEKVHSEFLRKKHYFTIRVEVACKDKTIRTALNSLPELEKLYMAPCGLNDGECYIVCYGLYENWDDADQALNTLSPVFFEEGNSPYVTEVRHLFPEITDLQPVSYVNNTQVFSH